MPGSYRRVNYTLRPAKYIERKMLGEAFRRLSPFGAVEGYRYVGFGSLYFSDFTLFHRELGIGDMVSIECIDTDAPRFEFNRPFGCIQMEYGWSNQVLPRLDWKSRTILWLDYDGTLDREVLTDVGFFCTSSVPGSLIIVSINVSGGNDKPRLQSLKENVGDVNVPADLEEKNLSDWGLSSACRRIINNKIKETLLDINGGRADANHLLYQQLFNFRYRDGARMLTIGGIVCERSQCAVLNSCGFDQLPYYRPGEDAYKIEVPLLTHKELRYLDTCFPARSATAIDTQGIPEDEAQKYSKIYRYFPTFAVSEL